MASEGVEKKTERKCFIYIKKKKIQSLKTAQPKIKEVADITHCPQQSRTVKKRANLNFFS